MKVFTIYYNIHIINVKIFLFIGKKAFITNIGSMKHLSQKNAVPSSSFNLISKFFYLSLQIEKAIIY